jgi:hypothetical protein
MYVCMYIHTYVPPSATAIVFHGFEKNTNDAVRHVHCGVATKPRSREAACSSLMDFQCGYTSYTYIRSYMFVAFAVCGYMLRPYVVTVYVCTYDV